MYMLHLRTPKLWSVYYRLDTKGAKTIKAWFHGPYNQVWANTPKKRPLPLKKNIKTSFLKAGCGRSLSLWRGELELGTPALEQKTHFCLKQLPLLAVVRTTLCLGGSMAPDLQRGHTSFCLISHSRAETRWTQTKLI